MASLKDILIEIKEDKDKNLKPENIKAGITILGVTGTYAGETTVEN